MLFGLRLLLVRVADRDAEMASWLEDLARRLPSASSQVTELWLSPPADTNAACELTSAPPQDVAAVALSDRLLVVSLRPHGNMHRLVAARLETSRWPTASVYVAVGPGLVNKGVADSLLRLGAVGWLVWDDQLGTADVERRFARAAVGPPGIGRDTFSDNRSDRPASIVDLPRTRPWPYLTHCTRRRDGPWPGQTPADYWDELILGHPAADRSALAALARIVASRKLLATAATVRGTTPVVSFTEVPLDELPALRAFRPHLARWDFEPYAFCVRRQWLAARGARPVVYGDENLWNALSNRDRPLFHKSVTARGGTDWSREREWRHVGDVDLEALPPLAGLVCVPTRDEAEHMARLSRWPVTVLGS
jgi:hypothetical protein